MPAESIRAEWRDDAACDKAIKQYPTLLGAWDGPNENGEPAAFVTNAKAICLSCPVRNICLQGALSNEEAQGTRGGYDFDSGRVPVGVAREIRDTMDLKIYPHQPLGRPKKATNDQLEETVSNYL